MTPQPDDARGRHGRHRPPPRGRAARAARPDRSTTSHPPLSGLALATFVLLAFLFSWSWWVPMALRGQSVGTGVGWPTHLPGLMGPAFAAVVVTLGWQGTGALRDLGRRAVRWRGVGRWWWSVPGILALGALAPALAFATGDPVDLGGLTEHAGAPVVPLALLVGYLLLVSGYGEELGWRGVLADGLVDRVGEVRAGLLVTLVGGIWHLPLLWVVADLRTLGWATVVWVLGLLAAPVVLTRLYVGSGRSVLLVALWHTAFDLTTATTATRGSSAAITTAAVVAAAVVVLVRARARDRAARSAYVARRGALEPGHARRATQSSSAGQRPAHCDDTIS